MNAQSTAPATEAEKQTAYLRQITIAVWIVAWAAILFVIALSVSSATIMIIHFSHHAVQSCGGLPPGMPCN